MISKITKYSIEEFSFVVTKFLIAKIKLLCYRYGVLIVKELISRKIKSFKVQEIKSDLVISLNDREVLNYYCKNKEYEFIISHANGITENCLEVFGKKILNKKNIDWNIDFISGYKWETGIFFKDYKQENIFNTADVKIPRELSRLHHFLILGQAYLLTGDEKYTQKYISDIINWIDENPLMYSINWGCTMDVAIRATNIIWSYSMFRHSDLLTKNLKYKIFQSLYEHGWFIYRNPEKSEFNNHNHYLADLAGQIHLGLIFQGLPEPKKWLKTGIRELFREIRLQILPTGMSYERSTNYNRLVLELILIPILLLKNNDYEIPADIWYRIEKMFEFIMHSLKPDGNTPIVGDQDDGRLLPFGSESNTDYRYLLSLGSIIFNRGDFKAQGDGYNIYCALLGGLNSKEKYESISKSKVNLSSIAFPDSGFYIMRKGDNYLFFNLSGKGQYPEIASGTHTHSDLLSFELYTYGRSFLVDPGSYVYTSDAEQRMLFRSTQMHNTVTIDGESQNVIRKEVLWDFERNAIPEIKEWVSTDAIDKVVARHTGYLRLKQPVIHQRSICFDKQTMSWHIKDELTGEGSHLFEWHFHFDTGIDFTIYNTEVKTICKDGKNLLITFLGAENIKLRKEKSFVSKAYGRKEDSFVLLAVTNSTCPIELNLTIKKVIEDETSV